MGQVSLWAILAFFLTYACLGLSIGLAVRMRRRALALRRRAAAAHANTAEQ